MVLVLAGYFLIPILDIEGAVLSIILMIFFATTITLYFISKYPLISLTKSELSIYIKFLTLLILLFVPIPNGILWRVVQLVIFILITLVIIDFKKYRMIIWFK